MNQARQITTLAWMLAACAGPSASGQGPPNLGPRDVAPNIYEVAPEQVATAQEAAFIEVNGTASVQVATDEAHVSFAMETRAEAADDAASTNAAAMERVLGALRGAALPDLDLATFGYSVQPQYSTDNNRVRTIVAYVAMNNVRATISDVEQVGRLIDVAIGAGANRVSSIAFTASDTEPARAEALAGAVRNAREQAAVMAEALGHELGPPLEIRGGAQRPIPRQAEMMSVGLSQARAATPIEAEDQTVRADVTVRFALGPERPAR